MSNSATSFGDLNFIELEDSFGLETAQIILHTLEQFEGIQDYETSNLSCEERFNNVIAVMRENIHYQTRH